MDYKKEIISSIVRTVIVDDDADCLAELQELFEHLGVATATYFCPFEARHRVLHDSYIQVVVSDLRINRLDGEELIQSIRSSLLPGRVVSFVILTGIVLPDGHKILGDVPCYSKPIDIDKLTDYVIGKLNYSESKIV